MQVADGAFQYLQLVEQEVCRVVTRCIAAKLFMIIRSLRVRGVRPSRIMSFATLRVVDAPSNWLDRMDSSAIDFRRYVACVAGFVTCAGAPIIPLACRST